MIMKNSFLLIISVLLLCSCKKEQVGETRVIGQPIPWTDSSNKHPKNAALTALLDKYHKKGFPGISLLVSDTSGTWVSARGKADLSNNIDFFPGTVSKTASITKFFMGVLMFRLMEDSANTGLGYRSLAQPVSNWIDAGIIKKLPNGNLITLGQAMKHETGIPDLIENDNFYLAVLNNPNKKWTQEQLLEYAYGDKPLFAPGDTAIYSNTNTILVTMVMEAATKRKHADLLREKILQPLGLQQTFYQPHDALPNSVAQGYYDLYNNKTLVNVSNLVTGSGNGYGGVYSNLFDLQKLINAVLVNKSFLKPASLALMETYGKTDGSNRYGYGIMKKFIERGADAGIGHSGRDVGYTCNLFYFPAKGVTHIFFINYGTDGDSYLRESFYQFQEELLNLSLN
jgi:D-alanyl-D-alanine carboxypeptidase